MNLPLDTSAMKQTSSPSWGTVASVNLCQLIGKVNILDDFVIKYRGAVAWMLALGLFLRKQRVPALQFRSRFCNAPPRCLLRLVYFCQGSSWPFLIMYGTPKLHLGVHSG